MEQIRNESKGMATAICDEDYRNRHFLWAQLSQYCSVLAQVRLSVGSSVYTCLLGASDEESSSKHFFLSALEYVAYKQFCQWIGAKHDFSCVFFTPQYESMCLMWLIPLHILQMKREWQSCMWSKCLSLT